MASTEIRDRRCTLRYRSLLVRQMVQMKNRVSGLLLETGVNYNKSRLHKVGYFADLMSTNEEVNNSIRPLLKISREDIMRAQKLDYALVSSLERDPLLAERLERLEDCSRRWADHRTDLGAGDRRLHTLPFDQAGHQLLRFVRRRGGASADKAMRLAAFQAAQQAYPARADRSRETCSKVFP